MTTPNPPTPAITKHFVAIPVDNLAIVAPRLKNGIQIGDVEFLPADAMKAHRKSFPASEQFDNDLLPHLFPNATTYVCFYQDGPPFFESTLFSRARTGVHCLAGLYSFWDRHTGRRGFNIDGHPRSTQRRFVAFDCTSIRRSASSGIHGGIAPVALDDDWLDFHSDITTAILEAMSDVSIDSDWRRQIQSACEMLGRGYLSIEPSERFLHYVIGLETLLTTYRERNGDKLGQRLNGMLGWHKGQGPNIANAAKNLHQVRCDIVHDAKYDNFGWEVIRDAEHFLRVSLHNAALNRSVWKSKAEFMNALDQLLKTNWPKLPGTTLRWIDPPRPIDKDGPLW